MTTTLNHPELVPDAGCRAGVKRTGFVGAPRDSGSLPKHLFAVEGVGSLAPVRPTAAQRLAALTELLARVQTAATPRQACRVLADELQRYLACDQVVVGLCRPGARTCRVEAISNVDVIDPSGDEARAAQAALQEAIARGDESRWPAPEENSRFGLKALEQYAASSAAEAVFAGPLRNERGGIQGAWLISGIRRRGQPGRCPGNAAGRGVAAGFRASSCSSGRNPAGWAACCAAQDASSAPGGDKPSWPPVCWPPPCWRCPCRTASSASASWSR